MRTIPTLPSIPDTKGNRQHKVLVAEFAGIMTQLVVLGCSWGIDDDGPEVERLCSRANTLADDLSALGYDAFVIEMNNWQAENV